jgi:hypothetical protein
MKSITDFIKANLWKVTSIVFALLFLTKGCTNNKISKLEKKYNEQSIVLNAKLDSLSNIASRKASKNEVRDQMELVMFDYLIYEDDLDKGKTSLSDIKKRIESND